MGIDISTLFGNAEDAATQGMNDLIQTGGNAALGYLEGQAVKIISSDASTHNAAAQTATASILQRPTNADSFGAYLSNLIEAPALKTYGPLVIGAVAFVVIGLILLK